MRTRRVVTSLVEDFLQEFVCEEFVPDILIEVFTHDGDEYAPVSPEEQRAYDAGRDILDEAIEDVLTGVVRGVIRDMVTGYMHDKGEALMVGDPLEAIVKARYLVL
jgi:hypothetical protein